MNSPARMTSTGLASWVPNQSQIEPHWGTNSLLETEQDKVLRTAHRDDR
jgi:hypothetical protein